MIQRLLLFPNWFTDRLNSSRLLLLLIIVIMIIIIVVIVVIVRYSHIPIGNLGSDVLTTVIDVMFARFVVVVVVVIVIVIVIL